MNRLYFIESKYNNSRELQQSLLFNFSDRKLKTEVYFGYMKAQSNLDEFTSDTIVVCDVSKEEEKELYQFFRILQGKIKYPRIILLVDNSIQLDLKSAFSRNPDFDQVKVHNKKTEFVEIKMQIESWLNASSTEKTRQGLSLIENDLQIINYNLSEYIAKNPQMLYKLTPRRFEELIADLFAFEGYQVELTPESNDGGKDIYAYKKDFFNEFLFAIECKRYSADNRVGRPIVQKLYGVVESERLTGGILVTSSFYTKPAIDYSLGVKNRLCLNDYYDLMKLINKYGKK